MELVVAIAIVAVSGLVAHRLLSYSKRNAEDVLYDLSEAESSLFSFEDQEDDAAPQTERKIKLNKEDELGKAGFFTRDERERFQRESNVLFGVIAVLPMVIALVSFGLKPQALVLGSLGVLLGYTVKKGRLDRRKKEFRKEVEFLLPMVMERMVMCAQAGLDIVASFRTIISLEEAAEQAAKDSAKTYQVDPITKLFRLVYRLVESGMPFKKALAEVSKLVESPPLRHCFIHLGKAYADGGELVMPLRELSDSTQLYYQELIEEEIAKLPVKATLPLVITFGGLFIIFLAAPVVSMKGFIQDASNQMEQSDESGGSR